MIDPLYPLKFNTIYKDKIWGGNKIKTVINKDFSPLPNCGETWELSGVSGNISEVSNGPLKGQLLTEVISHFKGRILGNRIIAEYGEEFPLLIKFIDAADDLSVQVHPDDELAAKRHKSKGKSEMWYILQADPGASLISGFNQQMTRESYQEAVEQGRILDVLNREEVRAGDVFYLPAGRIHTIGKGLLLAEIQQTSDVTYRIYDFDRTDNEGNKRELHTDAALDAIDFNLYESYRTAYREERDERVELVRCPYFITNKLELTDSFQIDHSDLDSFHIYICIGGSGELHHGEGRESVSLGDVLLLPAEISTYSFETSETLSLLESYIPVTPT